jgi:hypothetical protein
MLLRGTAVASVALASWACGLFDAPPPLPTVATPTANLLANGGFEAGVAPWVAHTLPAQPGATLQLSDRSPHAGAHAVELTLSGAEAGDAARAVVVTQAANPQAFPEFVSGYYRVDDWQPHAPSEYLYFSITVRGGDFPGGAPAHELRVLIGAPSEPELQPFLTFAFLSRAAPVLHRWTYFGFPVKPAFQLHFEQMPSRWDGIDVSVAVRFDGRDAGDAPSSASVLFDDLYAGTQVDNPNRPPDP